MGGWQRRGVLSGAVALVQPQLNLVKINSKAAKLEFGGKYLGVVPDGMNGGGWVVRVCVVPPSPIPAWTPNIPSSPPPAALDEKFLC